jgi:hypothetical protein
MSNATNKVEEIKNTIRNRVAQGANLSALIDLAHLRAEATNGGDAKLVRACLLDVFQEVNGEQAVDALLDKLGM